MIAFIYSQVGAQSYFPPDGVFDVGHLVVKYVISQKVFRFFTLRIPLVRTFPDAQNDQWIRAHLFVKYDILQKKIDGLPLEFDSYELFRMRKMTWESVRIFL